MMVNSNQTQKDLMEPTKRCFKQKNSHHSPNSTHNEENKTINLRMFLCVLNIKKMLTAHFSNWSQNVFFFISGIISFKFFQVLLFSFTLKPFIYFMPCSNGSSHYELLGTVMVIIFGTIWCWVTFYHKWNEVWLLVINKLLTSCLTSRRTIQNLGY